MKIVALFEPYSRRVCLDKVLNLLTSLNVHHSVLEDWGGLRALIEVPNDFDPRHLMSLDCVSRIFVVEKIVGKDLDEVLNASLEVVEKTLKGRRLRVEVRRWDKTFPIKSIDLARIVARKILEHGLAQPDPRSYTHTLFIGIERDRIFVGWSWLELEKRRFSIPMEVARSIVAVVDGIQTLYEAMDLIQLSRALGFELRFYRPAPNIVERALRSLGIEKPSNVLVIDSVDEAMEGIDLAIALSMHASRGEDLLLDVVSNIEWRRLGLVLGNEYRDVGEELRERCRYQARLGPATGMPMRTTTALAYALGILYTYASLGF